MRFGVWGLCSLALFWGLSCGGGNTSSNQPPGQHGGPPSSDGGVDGGPVDGGGFAPPIDETVPTSMPDVTEFLYGGANPIQTGVDAGTIEKERVAVIRGHVFAPDGTPTVAVTVTILGHPEFGQTLSRADGAYDIAVNGGASVTVVLELAGYLAVHRQVQTPWRDYVFAPDVVLTPLDPGVTSISGGASGTQVARGSNVADDAGTRQATLIFPAGTTATMTLPDSSTQSLSTLHVRATEYTVGDSGPSAMPGGLPPRSGYTYAVELSVDEAIAAGATSVEFSQPVAFYVENFLHFSVGSRAPVGSYSRTTGVWVAEPDGAVISVLDVSAGIAVLDVTGAGQPATPAELASLGISDAERKALAGLYPAGTSLWRAQLAHLSPWDINWPFGPPDDAIYPDQGPEDSEDDPNASCTNGSIIECENSVLGEEIPIAGTGLFLSYRSDRVPGRTAAYTTVIPLLPGGHKPIPASLAVIDVEVIGAGRRDVFQFLRRINGSVQALPASLTYTWDGKDGYGRMLNGPQPFTIRVGYEYGGVYWLAGSSNGRSFATSPSGNLAVDGEVTRRSVILWAGWNLTLGQVRHLATGAGGWSLSSHHTFQRLTGQLFRGDGSRSDAVASAPVVGKVVGGGALLPAEGLPASTVAISPTGFAVTADGSVLFINASASSQIWRVKKDGTLTLVAGTGIYVPNQPPLAGDGQQATTISLAYAIGLTVGPDGTIYFSQPYAHTVRKISPAGIVSTIAGTGTAGSTGDGGPASQATLASPGGVAVDRDGNVYVADEASSVVRRIDVNGTISTFAGNGRYGATSEGLLATSTAIGGVRHLAIAPDGTVYASTSDARVWKFDLSGRATVAFGAVPPAMGQGGFTPDGQPARGAFSDQVEGIAVTPEGRLLLADSTNARVRMVDAAGNLVTVAGNGDCCGPSPGQPAIGTAFSPYYLATAADGTFIVGQAIYPAGYRVAPLHAGYSVGESVVGSSDGAEAYVFDGNGRHLRTVDSLTGALHQQFSYDPAGRLISIVDGDGNTTSLGRDPAGNLTGIDAPFGQHTAIATDGNGYLASVTNPAGERITLGMGPTGMLTSLTDPKSQNHSFEYDALGRLTKDTNPSGGFKRLDRVRDGNVSLEVDVTTALGRRTVHRVANPAASSSVTRTVIQPDGTQEVTTEYGSAYRSTQAADGSTTTISFGSDGRFGVSSPLPFWSLRTPSGLTAAGGTSRSAVLSVAGDPLSLTSLTTTTTVNASAWTETFDAPTRTRTVRSPLGKVSTQVLDAKGRVVKSTVPGLADITYAYDSNGRLQSIHQGTRTVSLTFGSDGLPATSTDALNRLTTYTRDLAGRVRTSQLPGSRMVAFDYDQNGNLTSLTPPGEPAHQLTYGPRDEETLYTPPAVTSPPASPIGTRSTGYGYDLDGALTGVFDPDGTTVSTTYDSAGRLDTIQTSRTTVQMQYSPDAGQLVGMTDALASGPNPTASSIGLTYNGPLPIGTTWSGAVNGSVAYSYNSNLQVATSTVAGTPTVTNTFDLDLLLTSVAIGTSPATTLAISRNNQNGLLTGTSLGVVSTSKAYDTYGAATSLSASAGGTTLYSATLTPDAAGRIQQKVEIVQGVSHTYLYTYDDADRLTDVSIDGAAAGHWGYDANGNRKSGTAPNDPGTTLTATYDAQDRLLSYGSAQYAFGPRGDLRSKTISGKTTTYTYDELGALVSVTLADGNLIDYVIDAAGRRIGRKVNGVLDRGWIYEGIRPIAEIDGTGAVVARFVYGTRPHVPDMMWKAGVLYRLITDERGSVRLVVNASTGAVVQRLDYDVWGDVTADTAPAFQPFAYAGGLWEASAKLLRFGARDFDPETGRWTSKDPIRFVGGDTNVFTYVGDDPINSIDPTGLMGPGTCRRLREVIDFERSHGYIETARVYSNTRGAPGLGPDFNNTPIPSVLGGIDLDWYTEIIDRGGRKGAFYTNWALYTAGKIWWGGSVGFASGRWSIYSDPSEAVALQALYRGYGYSDLFPDWLLAQECPCGK
jgi:RHS repeat-associated protein